jgi:hypothetical protein
MDITAGSAARNRTILTGIVGALVGLLFGISITTFAANAVEPNAAAAGPDRGAGLVDPSLFEAAPVRGAAAAGPDRGAGLVDPSLFEAAPVRGAAAAGPDRGAGLVDPSLFEAAPGGE